jgi:hypothetical protein
MRRAGMETPVKRSTWKSTTGGVLTVVPGVFGILCCLGLIVFAVLVGGSGTVSDAVLDYLTQNDISGLDIPLIQNLAIVGAVFFAITATLALIGGIFALQRRMWGMALVGSIAAILGSWWPIGIAATVFIAISRDEFK